MKLPIHRSKLINKLIEQEDTTGSLTITVEDNGKKEFILYNQFGNELVINGTYYISNLLQEAALLDKEEGCVLLDHIIEKPVERISRLIKNHYWKKLTRSFNNIDLIKVLEDEKMSGDYLRIYVPETDIDAINFYNKIAKGHDKVKVIPIEKNVGTEKILRLNKKPGILGLAISENKKESLPFVVPGGRFNEMYGWDSYFIGLGLMIDDKFHLAKSMVDNLEYQILYYGKILNANRSYFLSRSQPPFMTSFVREFYQKYEQELGLEWLNKKLTTCILEYYNVWMTPGIRLCKNGLNRYFDEAHGIPPETEKGHFDNILQTYAEKYKLTVEEFIDQYKNGVLIDEEIDSYFVHDRSMRESGHDTTSRLDNISANLNTVDLNSLLYKYEMDIAYLIKVYFHDSFSFGGRAITSDDWISNANSRKERMQKLMWNEKEGSFYDYNFIEKRQQTFDSITNLYPLWAQLCSDKQAQEIATKQLPKFIQKGGLSSTSEIISNNIMERQWDFPYGWAPHQIIVWKGLLNYNFNDNCQELIYRWLWLIVKTVVSYNGLIPEKFDVKNCTHQVDVEYGNVGSKFKYIPDGGFGWTNASFKVGVKLLSRKNLECLNNVVDPDEIFVKD